MAVEQIVIKRYICNVDGCGHRWPQRVPGDPDPVHCPKCGSRTWNKPQPVEVVQVLLVAMQAVEMVAQAAKD